MRRSFGTGPVRTKSDEAVGPQVDAHPALAAPAAAPAVADGPAAIAIRGVEFSYPADGQPRPALASVTFQVQRGELAAVIGANGTGKSTLLKLIAGLLTPDAGMISVEGTEVHGPESRVGLVFQEPRLLPWRSVLANVAFPLELAGWAQDRRDARARQLLDLVGLADVADLRPHQLSGGMRQRASIARALALEPSVLLLDEPFSALDALTRERFNDQLQGIWRQTGTTILLVTHSIPEAIFLADRVLVFTGRPGHLDVEVPIGLARPRTFDALDGAEAAAAAASIRRVLESDQIEAEPGEPAP
jgi:NitT/TauT family transport system ATP-binding protein